MNGNPRGLNRYPTGLMSHPRGLHRRHRYHSCRKCFTNLHPISPKRHTRAWTEHVLQRSEQVSQKPEGASQGPEQVTPEAGKVSKRPAGISGTWKNTSSGLKRHLIGTLTHRSSRRSLTACTRVIQDGGIPFFRFNGWRWSHKAPFYGVGIFPSGNSFSTYKI